MIKEVFMGNYIDNIQGINYVDISTNDNTIDVKCTYCGNIRAYRVGEMVFSANYNVNGRRKLLKFCSYTCRARYSKINKPHRY